MAESKNPKNGPKSSANAGRTSAAKDGEKSPRLPHERDESSDSGTSEPRDVIRQAKADLDSGKQATDRGEATDAAYQRQKR